MKKLFLFIFFFLAITIDAQEDEIDFELVSIQFHGNVSIPTSRLQNVILSKESPGWFSQLLNGISENLGNEKIFFDSLLIPSDVEALKNFYFDNGFFKVKFIPRYYLDTLDEEATIVYHIEENDPSYFRSFKIGGESQIELSYWQKINNEMINIDTTVRYSRKLVEDKIYDITSFLRDHGHMIISNKPPEITIDTLLNKVDVFIDFDFGLRYKVSEVRVQKTGVGKELVSEDLLKEIVDINPGDYYSFYETERGQVRLYRTNLFNSALVTGIISDTSGNKVPIGISTDIGLMHELSPEILVNDDNGLNLGFGLSFTKKNFLGSARRITVATSAAAQNPTEFITKFSLADTLLYGYADARLILEQPFIFGKPINTRIESYLTLQKRKNEWNANIVGAKLNLDFELPRFTYLTSLSTYFTWENSEFIFQEIYIRRSLESFINRTINDPAAKDSALQELNNRAIDDLPSKTTNAVLGVELGANKTDNLLFPTKGYRLSILVEDGNGIPYLIKKISGNALTNPAYLKTVFTFAWFPNIYEDQTSAFGLKLKLGRIRTYAGNQFDIPLNQRFSSGGANSIRGWNALELVPENNTPPDLSSITPEEFEQLIVRGLTPGGFLLMEGSIETRNRLSGKIGSAFFIDYGNTWNGFDDIRWDNIALAAGFGFRFYSDFAPIRIDFGFKIYDPLNRSWIFKRSFFGSFSDIFSFHIGIGESF